MVFNNQLILYIFFDILLLEVRSMSIFFIITYILFIYSFLRIEKTKNKLNILLWIFISVITYMGYNSIIIYLLSILKIHSTLLLRSILNIIFAIIMIIISKKKKQKYYFDKMDFGVIIILFYLSFLIFIFRFGFKFNLSFKITDGAVHFAMAKSFMNSAIYDNTMTNALYNISDRGMFFSSTNAGTFLELLKPITGELALYKGFIIFEMLSFFLSGCLLYFIVRRDKVNNKNYLLTILFLILYQLGYPLLNLLCGFHYWGLVILVISSIILTVRELVKNKMYKNIFVIAMLFIQVLSVFITYYLYVPVVYGSLGLYFLYLWRIKKELTLRKSIIYIIIILFIPFCFGIIFFNIFGDYISNFGTNTNMAIDGSTYKNLIGNFICLLPLVFYNIINEIKNKKITLITIISFLNIIYMIILFIFCMKGIMSNYYFSKIYNLLWLICFIYLINAIYDNKDGFIRFYLYFYVIVSILACFRVESIIYKHNYDISDDTVISNIGNIYDKNISIFKEREVLIDNNILELLKEVKKNTSKYKNKREEIPFVTKYFRKLWITQIIDVVASNNYNVDKKKVFIGNTLYANSINEVKNDDDVTYFIWIPDEENCNGVNIDDYIIIFQNNAGYILKKK